MDFEKIEKKAGRPKGSVRQREAVDERAAVEWAESIGLMVTKMSSIGRRGWPDRCFWLPGGKPFFIEFKAGGEEPTKIQKHIHSRLKVLGYDVETHDNKETAIAAIKSRLIHHLDKKVRKKAEYRITKSKENS